MGLCLGAAFLPPIPRTLAFTAGGALLVGSYYWVFNWNLGVQVALYLLGGIFFIR